MRSVSCSPKAPQQWPSAGCGPATSKQLRSSPTTSKAPRAFGWHSRSLTSRRSAAFARRSTSSHPGIRSTRACCASWRGRGFEIGLHGLRHDHSLFTTHEAFQSQLPAIDDAARSFRAQGFRSPSTHRVHEWLGELPLSWGYTLPHSDPLEPMPGGCCTLWPYFIDDVVEVPYTLTQDHTLFTVLQRKSAADWLRQVEAIERRHGLIHCLSHPDPGYLGDQDNRAFYAELLDAVADRPQLWKPLPARPRRVVAST